MSEPMSTCTAGPRRLLCMLLVAAVAAACGDDGSGSSGITSTSVMETTSSTAVAVGIHVAACSLLTLDEVAETTGLAVVDTSDEGTDCIFDLGAEAGVSIFLTVDDGRGSAMAPSAVLASYREAVAAGDAEPVDGLGDEAVYSPGFRGLAVDAGSGAYFLIGVNGGYAQLTDPRDQLVELARIVVDRLGR